MILPKGLLVTALALSRRIERKWGLSLTVYGGHASIRHALLPLSMRLKLSEGFT